VAELNALFWDSPHTLRFGIAENLYGHDAIAGFRSGRPAMDLTRNLMNTVITSYGGKWQPRIPNSNGLADGAGPAEPRLVRTDQGWRIAAAHVSLLLALGAGQRHRQASRLTRDGVLNGGAHTRPCLG